MWERTVESRNALEPSQRERGVFLYADEAQYFANSYDDSFLSTCRGSRAAMIYLTQNLPAYYSRFGKDKTDAADGLVGKFATQLFFANACPRTNKFASELIGRAPQQRANASRSVGSNRSQGMSEGSQANRGTSSGKGSSFGGHGGASFNSNNGGSSG